MRQTIRTKNYNTTIQIPYQKLASKHNCIPLDSLTSKQNNESNGKTLVIHGCQGNLNKQSESITIEMLEELEAAFQTDMKQKDKIISGLQQDLLRVKLELGMCSNEVERYRQNGVEGERKYLQAVRTIKQQQKLVQQLTTEQQQNTLKLQILSQQNLTLNQNTSQTKIRFIETETQLIRIRQKLAVEEYKNLEQSKQIDKLSQSLEKVTLNCSRYEVQYRELVNNKQMLINKIFQLETAKEQLIRKIQTLVAQNQDLSKNVTSKEGIIVELNFKVGNLEQQVSMLKVTITEKQREIINNKSQITTLLQALSKTQNALKKSQQTTKVLAEDLLNLQGSENKIKHHYECLDLDFKQLAHRCQGYEVQVEELTKSNGMFVKKIVDLQNCIGRLELQLRQKEVPKSFDVKIERVVDRQDYISEIQAKLEQSNHTVAKQIEKIKDLEKLLFSKDKQLQDKRLIIVELEKSIQSLKIYIEQKQKSFAWIVQRQIIKDMQLSKDQQLPTYKVYPTSPTPASSKHNSTSIPASQPFNLDSRNLIIGGNYIDSTNILNELQRSSYNQQLHEAIMREADGRKY